MKTKKREKKTKTIKEKDRITTFTIKLPSQIQNLSLLGCLGDKVAGHIRCNSEQHKSSL